jgi:hypothetical protein
MQELATRVFENMLSRVDGPMHFRLIFQPLMAVLFATRDGIKDAKEGRAPYFWSLFTSPGHRREIVRSGWKSVGKIFILALILDAIYQVWQFHWFYPGEATLVAIFLAIIPYLLIRGPVDRFVSRRRAKTMRAGILPAR